MKLRAVGTARGLPSPLNYGKAYDGDGVRGDRQVVHRQTLDTGAGICYCLRA